MSPVFPLKVAFDDGETWVLATAEEVAENLEWFDSEDGDRSVTVVDAQGRPVRLHVEAFQIIRCEVEDDRQQRATPPQVKREAV